MRILLTLLSLTCLGILTVAADAQNSSIGPAAFGMHEHNLAVNGWPKVPFGSFRIVGDQVPNVSWADIEPSRGHYDWSKLDTLINRITPHNVDIVYTFWKVPRWASSRPEDSCGKGDAGECYPPVNPRDWQDFVTAITSRYRGRIKYWEVWNEPNANNFWSATAAQMVTMASEVYPIIRASGGIVVSPCPQGTSADRWMKSYLDAGGGDYSDIIAFHGYLGASNLDNIESAHGGLVTRMMNVMANREQASKELWDTEHSWGRNADYPDQDLQASWLARHEILGFALGVRRSFWYAWSDATIGTLYDKVKHVVLPAGTAYGVVYEWLNRATFASPCSASGAVWTCELTLGDGSPAQVIWDASKTCSSGRCTTSGRSVSPRWTAYRDIAGETHPITGHSVPLGIKPILLTGR